jgi:uncharacterized membrane protein
MSLIPDWVPNLHPLVIHFPIALLITAAAVDLANIMFGRPAWEAGMAAYLYTAGAISALAAYLTGRDAAAMVFVPGMAHGLMDDHWNWALLTTCYFTVFAAIRLSTHFARAGRSRCSRVLLVALGLIGVAFLHQTAERGARLVYEHGVGVIGVGDPGPLTTNGRTRSGDVKPCP